MATNPGSGELDECKSKTLDEEDDGDQSQREPLPPIDDLPDVPDEQRKKVHFAKRAHVKLIPCDQLDPFRPHKSRMLPCEMRRRWVLTKIYQMGGYIRDKGKKKFAYVAPNTPLPKIIARGKEDLLFDST